MLDAGQDTSKGSEVVIAAAPDSESSEDPVERMSPGATARCDGQAGFVKDRGIRHREGPSWYTYNVPVLYSIRNI